jgi:hypothetical protein
MELEAAVPSLLLLRLHEQMGHVPAGELLPKLAGRSQPADRNELLPGLPSGALSRPWRSIFTNCEQPEGRAAGGAVDDGQASEHPSSRSPSPEPVEDRAAASDSLRPGVRLRL